MKIDQNKNFWYVPLFILQVLLTRYLFFPQVDQLNGEEAVLILAGRQFLHGLESPAGTPFLLKSFYALTGIPFYGSDDWLLRSASFARFMLMGLLWLVTCLTAKRLSKFSHPLIIPVLLLAFPAVNRLISGEAVSLCILMNAFAFWQLLGFYNDGKIRHVFLSLGFSGCSTLLDPGHAWLGPVIVIFTAYFALRLKRFPVWLAVPALLPHLVWAERYSLACFEKNFGLLYGPILFLLALRGLIDLFSKKNYRLFFLFALWPLQSWISTFQSPPESYPLEFAFLYLYLAAFGAQTLSENAGKKIEILAWLTALLTLAINKFTMIQAPGYASALYGLVAIYCLQSLSATFKGHEQLGMYHGTVLCALMIILGSVSGLFYAPSLRALRFNPTEPAAEFLINHLPPESKIAVPSPRYAWMANKKPVKIPDDFSRLNGKEALETWIEKSGVSAIYVHRLFQKQQPELVTWIESLEGTCLELAFQNNVRGIKIYLVQEKAKEDTFQETL